MRINIYETLQDPRISRERIRRLIRRVLKNERKEFAAVNVVLTDDAYLKRLNYEYFRKNRTTNVISFNLGDVAEIYISEYRARNTDELYYFVVHGLLHAIGYDHANRKESVLMNKKCLEYLPA